MKTFMITLLNENIVKKLNLYNEKKEIIIIYIITWYKLTGFFKMEIKKERPFVPKLDPFYFINFIFIFIYCKFFSNSDTFHFSIIFLEQLEKSILQLDNLKHCQLFICQLPIVHLPIVQLSNCQLFFVFFISWVWTSLFSFFFVLK